MKCLYIDTSSSFLYSAIVDNNKLLASISKELLNGLSKEALIHISEMFNKAQLKPNDIDKIIVVNGPGSFTGIRVGITIAKIFAWGLKKEISVVNSLEAMSLANVRNKYIVPIIDARRNYVYAAIYNNKGIELVKPQYISLDDLKKILDNYSNYVFVTHDVIDIQGKKVKYYPNFLKIVKKVSKRESINPHFVNPSYLKLTEAEEKSCKLC